MSETRSRLGRTIGNLLLALLNATLILVALCLFLGWQLAEEVSAITDHVGQKMVKLEALGNEVSSMSAEMTALRSELSKQSVQADPMTLQKMQELSAKLDRIDQGMADTKGRVDAILEEPNALVDRAVDRTTANIKEIVAYFANCPAEPKQ
ncbi:MAG: hypothetical protein RIC87_16780 [Kiloniellales bacterium]